MLRNQEEQEARTEPDRVLAGGYVSKRRPREKQLEALKSLRGRNAFALLMEMRTGKTKVIIDDWGRMVSEDKVLDLLVIAPGGAYLPWADAARADLPDELLKLTRIFTWVSGKAANKGVVREREAFLSHEGPRILIVNIEAIGQVARAREMCVAFLKQTPDANMLVIDESVIIKNESKAGNFCVETLSKLAAHRRILSGLISPRSPLDLYYQFKFLDPSILGYDRFTAFRARYAKVKHICMVPQKVIRSKFEHLVGLSRSLTDAELNFKLKSVDPEFNLNQSRELKTRFLQAAVDGMKRDDMIDAIGRLGGYVQTVPTIEKFLNVHELHDKIAPYSFRVRLSECYDMPKSDYSFYDVTMTPEQEKIYADLKAFATAELAFETHVTANHVVTQMLRLHQVLCGHTKDENGKVHLIPERRTKSLLEILEGYAGKAIVWCSYDADVRKVSDALTQEYGDGSTARFWGGNQQTREAEEVEFKTNPRCRFMVATPDAGGRGRDWSVADLVIYYSSRNNLDHRAQSEDRPKAVGKDRPIAYVDLRVRGTVEERIIEAIRAKMDLSMVINGDNWREWLV